MVKSSLNDKHRKLLVHLYHSRYKLHLGSADGCFYCGDVAESIDHCPPLSWCDAKQIKWFEEKKIKFYLVRCCNQCNQKLSNKPFFTLEERAEFVKQYLQDKLSKFVVWDEEEIKEMSSMFKKMIKAKNQQRKYLMFRLTCCTNYLLSNNHFPEP